MHNSAQLRCFENGNDDFGVEAFWIGDAARVGYFVPLNGHPPSRPYNSDFLWKDECDSVTAIMCSPYTTYETRETQ